MNWFQWSKNIIAKKKKGKWKFKIRRSKDSMIARADSQQMIKNKYPNRFS